MRALIESDIPPLPEDPEFREKLATIISSIGRCDRDALLEGKSFATVMSDFDSIMVLEILLEIETEFHITTDDMLPTDGAYKPQEITNAFPEDLDGLMAYMRTVVVRVAEEKAAAKEAAKEAARLAAIAAAEAADKAPAEGVQEPAADAPAESNGDASKPQAPNEAAKNAT
jgi:acyl carrier protein